MTKVIIMGHGGYGSAFERSLKMLVGELEGFSFVDFNEEDDLSILKNKINEAIKEVNGEEILFCADLTGGSPFNVAAMMCTDNPNYVCVAGLNTTSYAEISFNLDMTVKELAKLAIDTAKASVNSFPPIEE